MLSNYFSINIKFLREQKGLNQDDFAEIFDSKRSAVGHWEAGNSSPNLEKLLSIANYFGITLDKLVTEVLDDNITISEGYEKGYTSKKTKNQNLTFHDETQKYGREKSELYQELINTKQEVIEVQATTISYLEAYIADLKEELKGLKLQLNKALAT